MKCKYCGADLIGGTHFCVKCGVRNDEENLLNEKQQIIMSKPLVVTLSIVAAVALIAFVALIILCLPPSESRIGSDALNYADIESEYTVSDILVSKTDDSNGFFADVQIDAVKNDNNDNYQFHIYFYYSRNGLSYDKTPLGMLEPTVYPNHNPTENDFFPLPKVFLTIKDSHGSSKRAADNDKIAMDIDYDHVIVSQITAEVPIRIVADYANAKGESTVTVQYTYEGNYVWSGEHIVTVDLQPKYIVPEELITEDIRNNTFLYNSYISEELDGTYMNPGAMGIQYSELFTHAEVKTDFNWQNDAVKLTGNLLLYYDYRGDSWVFSGGQIDADSVNAEWSEVFNTELLVEQLPGLIAGHCTENNEISNIEIIDTLYQDGKTIVTVNYNSVQKPFLFKNEIELYYNATALHGYQLDEIREISNDYVGINDDYDEYITVEYSANLVSSWFTDMTQDGTATLHLQIGKSGEVRLQGKIGTIPLDSRGAIKYPSGALSLDTSEAKINVGYVLIIRASANLNYYISPSLTYHNGKLSGSIAFDTYALGVEDFSIYIS